MKRILIAAASLFLAAGSVTGVKADEAASMQSATEETAANDYVDFFFNGFTMKVPQGMPVNMEGNEALVKSPDGTFGISLKIEKDAKATAVGAYELCKRVITDLHLQEAKLTKVSVNGMEGACVEGKLEGMGVGVEILDAGKRYLKAIAIFDPAHADDAKTALMSVKKD